MPDAMALEPTIQQRFRRWVELTDKKRQLEADLRPIADELSAMEEPLIEAMTSAGIQSIQIDGMSVFKQREFYARIKEGLEKQDVFDRLRAEGLSNCIQLGHQTLRGMAREWMEGDAEPPKVVTECLDIVDNFRLRARKA